MSAMCNKSGRTKAMRQTQSPSARQRPQPAAISQREFGSPQPTSRYSRLPCSQITPLSNLDILRILLTSLQRLEQSLDGKQRHMPHLRRRTVTVHRLDGMIHGSHAGGEPESKRGVHGEFGVVDDGAGRVVGVVDACLLTLFVGESGVSVCAMSVEM